ncbi:hypothetical protein ABIB00_004123 [Bradyrhizobium sp. LB14.3]
MISRYSTIYSQRLNRLSVAAFGHYLMQARMLRGMKCRAED